MIEIKIAPELKQIMLKTAVTIGVVGFMSIATIIGFATSHFGVYGQFPTWFLNLLP